MVTRGLLALLAGALPAAIFPELGFWWLAYVGLVPALLVTRSARTPAQALVCGWATGTGFLLATHHWLLPNLQVFLPVVTVVLGVLWLPWGYAAWRLLAPPVGTFHAVSALVVLPGAWLFTELVRSQAALGGPWGLLGTSQWQVPPARALAAIGGVWLLGLVIVCFNVAVLIALFGSGTATAQLVAWGAALGLAAAVLGAPLTRPGTPEEDPLRIAMVQPGLTQGAAERFSRGEALTRSLAGERLDLVVWGESSVGYDLTARPDLERRLSSLARAVGADLLVNVDAARPGGGIFKSAVLIGPDGQLDRYDKMRLVPFGEYVPLRSLFGWATRMDAAETDRGRGARPVLMTTSGGLHLAPMVCFEEAFPDMARAVANRGARLLVYQSSTSTFQESWAPEQQATLGALRAAETGLPVVHATLTGQSTVFDPDGGRVGNPLGTSESGVLVVELPRAGGPTPYREFGNGIWIVTLSAAWLIGLLSTRR